MTFRKALPLIFIILCIALALFTASCGGNAYRVEFYVDGELYKYFLVEEGGYIEEVPAVPTVEGMSGVWSVTYFDEITSDMKVHAVYSRSFYTVKFYVDGELYEEKSVRKNSALADIPAVPERAGYRGTWNVTDFAAVNKDLTVTAVYTALEKTVTFMSGDEVVALRYVTDGTVLKDIPDVPCFTGKNYSSKWVVRTDGSTEDADFNAIYDDLTLYAHYYVTVTLSGGFSETEAVSAELGESVAVPDSGSLDGYEFYGWYADPYFGEKITFPTVFEENATIYGRWLSSESDLDFTFENGALTGYNGAKTEVVVPYKYVTGGEEVIVTSVAPGAFNGSSLTKITLPSTVTEIGAGAFQDCADLQEVVFANGSFVEIIKENAFDGCVSLKTFEFSRYTAAVGAFAFRNCSAVKEYVGLGSAVINELSEGAFYANTMTEKFTLPATLEKIGARAFYNNYNAQFVFNGISALKYVESGAFEKCVRLTSFNAPSLVRAEDGAFTGCYSLNTVTMNSDQKLYKLFAKCDGDFFYTVAADGAEYSLPLSLINVVVTPNLRGELNAGTLVENAFYNCVNVKNVTLLSGVRTIENNAFLTNVNATERVFTVNLSNTLESIGDYAFEGRKDLQKIDFPLSLVRIGEYVFNGLTGLREVTIGANNALVDVGKYAFAETAWQRDFVGVVKIGRVALGISDSYVASIGKTELNAEDFAEVNSIAPYAFANNNRIQTVFLPDNVIRVGSYAFAKSTALREIYINSYCEFEESILAECALLEKVTVGAEKYPQELFGTDDFEGSLPHVFEGTTYYIPEKFISLTILADDIKTIRQDIYTDFASLKEINIGEGITAIWDGAFKNNSKLIKVSLPSTVTEIGYLEGEEIYVGVFYNSTGVKEITMPSVNSLSVIHPYAFADTSLEQFVIPAGVTNIGEKAFADTKLNTLTFEEGEDELVINERAFYNISGFNSFTATFPSRLRAIGEEAFAFCAGLTGVELNDCLVTISPYAFRDCGITELDLPLSVKFYDEENNCLIKGALKNNPIKILTLRSPVLMTELFDGAAPNTLSEASIFGTILNEQFQNIVSLQTINLSEVDTIGERAFYGCSGIRRVTVPPTVTRIGDYAFAYCTSLISCVFEEGSVITSVGNYLFEGDAELKGTSFPSTVTNTEFIGVFKDCVTLTEANIPESVIYLGDYAFYNNKELTSITIPSEVRTIGNYAFSGCEKMEFENIKFADLESLGEYAFAGCKLLRGVKAESIQSIGNYAFDGCTALKELTVIDKKASDYISQAENITTINISGNATAIAKDIFDGCVNLTTVMVYTAKDKINDILAALKTETIYSAKIFLSVESYSAVNEGIKDGGFGEVLFPNPTEINGSYEFDEIALTAKLVSAEFDGETLFLPTYAYKDGVEYRVTEIGNSVFRGNTNLRELTIPYTVEAIGDYAFYESGVARINFEIGSKLNVIGQYAFYKCTNLISLELPDSLQRIEKAAFYGVSNLKSMETTVYSRLAYIGEYAFYGAAKLENLYFNKAIEVIAEHAFDSCGIKYLEFDANAAIEEITAYSFANCYSLTAENVILPADVVVHSDAFKRN